MNQKINRKITTIGTEVANLLNKQIAIELNNNKIYLSKCYFRIIKSNHNHHAEIKREISLYE